MISSFYMVITTINKDCTSCLLDTGVASFLCLDDLDLFREFSSSSSLKHK